MTRYKDRPLRLKDLVPRFEKKPTSTHVRNALAAIQRLGDEGREFWPDGDSSQRDRWLEGCRELQAFINRLGERRSIRGQDLPTALREFIQEFEHTTGRMFQMLRSLPGADDATDPRTNTAERWCNLAFKCSVYALTASWIDDKAEEIRTDITMTMGLAPGETTTAQHTTKTKTMKVPGKYDRATKDILRSSA